MAETPRKRPFWMHQVVEYILGVALVATGVQSPTPVAPAVIGGLIILHAAITHGPLAAFNWISRRTHRIIDLVIISIEFVAALQPWVSIESGTRIVMMFVAVVHAFVWWQSSFATKVKTPKEERVAGDGDRSTDIGRSAGRMVGSGVNSVKRFAAKRRD